MAGYPAGPYNNMEHYLIDIGTFVFTVLAIIVVWKIFSAPIKAILKFILHVVLGIVILVLVNFAGGFLNYYIPLNGITVLIAGLGGIPGVALLVIYMLLF